MLLSQPLCAVWRLTVVSHIAAQRTLRRHIHCLSRDAGHAKTSAAATSGVYKIERTCRTMLDNCGGLAMRDTNAPT